VVGLVQDGDWGTPFCCECDNRDDIVRMVMHDDYINVLLNQRPQS
jgi:hypothetical protein